jgi:hypothetical protein
LFSQQNHLVYRGFLPLGGHTTPTLSVTQNEFGIGKLDTRFRLENHANAWIVYFMHYTSYVLLPAFTGQSFWFPKWSHELFVMSV